MMERMGMAQVPVYMCYKYRRHNCYTQEGLTWLDVELLTCPDGENTWRRHRELMDVLKTRQARAIYVIHNLGYQGQWRTWSST